MSNLDRLPQSEQQKIAAWTACRPIQGFPETEYRVDAYGSLILWSHYGSQSEYGWEIDHRVPRAVGGSDGLNNLRALHWRKNRELGGLLGNALNALSGDQAPKPMTQPRNIFTGKRGFGF